MTLLQTIQAIEAAARMQPSVAMIVPNDVFRLNATPDARYGVFAWTQRQHAGDVDGDFHRFAFSLFYVDRLTADKANEVEIQSVGIQTLEAVLRELRDQGIFPVDGYTFDTFNQRFEDECAGVWCSVTFEVPVSPLCVNPEPVPPGPEPPAEWTGLTFTCEEAGVLSFYLRSGGQELQIEVSTDEGKTWETKTATTEGTPLADLQPGEKVLVRGNNTVYANEYFNATGKFAASGNIMSLTDSDGYEEADTVADYAFTRLFSLGTADQNWLTTAPELPATKLGQYCYASMFYRCQALTKAPELPATTLASSCYASMFGYCQNLLTAPAILPAMSLKTNCYRFMFEGCRILRAAPELPATELAASCYEHMFSSANGLSSAPAELPATTLAPNCYHSMFRVTAISVAPKLPAAVLVLGCYHTMFESCPRLQEITCLATDLSAPNALSSWCAGSTFPSSGTFRKATGVDWPGGTSGIPAGWTVDEV